MGENRRKTKWWKYLIFAVCAFYGVVAIITAVDALEHYARVYQNPLTVTARVMAHVEEDDDSYQSLLSYAVEGKTYEGIVYKEKNNAGKLTPVGQTVTVQVSPEDPSRTMEALLRYCGTGITVTAVIWCFLAGFAWKWTLRRFLSREEDEIPETEILERDLRLVILSGKGPIAWLVLGGMQIAVWLYYREMFTAERLIFPIICIVVAGIYMISGIRKLRAVGESTYSLRRDSLSNIIRTRF